MGQYTPAGLLNGVGQQVNSEYTLKSVISNPLLSTQSQFVLNNYDTNIFRIRRKVENDPSQGYILQFNGSIEPTVAPEPALQTVFHSKQFTGDGTADSPLALADVVAEDGTLQPAYSNAPIIFYLYDQHTGITQDLIDWGQNYVVFGMKMNTDAQKARIRDAFACDIFNVSEELQNQRILDAVNAISFWSVGGSSVSGIQMTKSCTATVAGEVFWLGAIPAGSFSRNGVFQVDLFIHKPHLTGLLGAQIAQVIQIGWNITFTGNGGCYALNHFPFIDIQV
jgi:hypothetical protein